MTGLDDVHLDLVTSVDKAAELLRWLGERHEGPITFDTETSGLSPEVDRVRLTQLGDAHHGWAIPWNDWGGVFKEALSRYDGPLTGHNVVYDYSMLRHAEGYVLAKDRLHCTRMKAHVVQPNETTALKPLATRHVDKRAGMLQSDLGLSDGSSGWTWATVPIDYEPYWTYGALDCPLTSQLDMVLDPIIDTQKSRRAYELELAASFVTDQMERNGVPIDVEYAATKLTDFQARARVMSKACEEAFGCKPGQNAKLREIFLEAGIELTKMTDGGDYSLDKEVMGGIDHPLADLVIQYRRLTKLASTYLRHMDTERIHPDINPVGARTSRMSMSNMNFQNLPRKADASPEAIEVRNCIRAREGYTLVFCDFDQIEVRLLGHLTNRLGYPEIINAFLSPEDFFVVVARDVYQEPDFQKSDLRRTTVKNFVYGGNYGAGVDKLSQTAGITYEQAMVVDEGLKRAYPGIKALHCEVEQQALRRLTEEGVAYVKSPFTGRRHPLGRGEATYVLVNYLIQGTAAELFKLKLLELDNAGLGPYMILPIHDEVILEVPTEDVPDVVSTLKSVMNDDQLLAVPITAGVSVGERWGQKRDYDPEEWKHAKARPQLHP